MTLDLNASNRCRECDAEVSFVIQSGEFLQAVPCQHRVGRGMVTETSVIEWQRARDEEKRRARR